MSTVIVVQETSAALSDALATLVDRMTRKEMAAAPVDTATAWQALVQALDQSQLTPRQRELVLLDMLGLRRAQIAEAMGVTPATLTTYWKAIYDRYGVSGADARAELHRQLFAQVPAQLRASLRSDEGRSIERRR